MLGLMMAFAATLPISVAGEPPVPAPPAGAVTLLDGPMRGTFTTLSPGLMLLFR